VLLQPLLRVAQGPLVAAEPDPAPLGCIGEDLVVERALAEPWLVLDAVDEPAGVPQGFDEGVGDVLVGEDREAAVH